MPTSLIGGERPKELLLARYMGLKKE